MESRRTLLKMAEKLDKVSSSFCLAKWLQVTIHLQNGHTHSCHHPETHSIPLKELEKDVSALHNTDFKKQQRKKMLNGIKPKECSYCWKIEKLPGENISDRAIKSADPWAAKHFDRVKSMPWDQNIKPTYLEVSFSNKCNFRCLYCAPSASSSWAQEIKVHGPYKLEYDYLSLEELEKKKKTNIEEAGNPYIEAFWHWLPEVYPRLEHLRITGGEPLLSDNTYKVLDYAAANPNKKLQLSINSNLGVSPDKLSKLIESVRVAKGNIKEFTFYTSLDTWGPSAEYIRTGLKCETFEKNLKVLIREIPGLQVTVMCTFNALSLSSFGEFLKKVREWKKIAAKNGGQLILDTSYLKDPPFLSVLILPKVWFYKFQLLLEDMKKGAFSEFEISKFERLVEYFNETPRAVDEDIRNFINFIEMTDQRRKTAFDKNFPEYLDLMNVFRAIRARK